MHVVLDNLGACVTGEADRWRQGHTRFHLHFSPTLSSWLNAVGGWLSMLTNEVLERRSFRSILELQRTTREFMDRHYPVSFQFVWTRSTAKVLRRSSKIGHLAVTAH